jgi:dTMP kinase
MMMRSHRGLFITVEKTREGLGGTTLATNLANALRAQGYEVVLTKESGGTELGQQIRKMLKDPNNKLSKATELFLQLADRAQHYKEVLKPNLRDGKIVISDRYFDSTLMYQGAGRGWKTAFLWRLHHATTGSLLPNLTIVLDGKPFRELDTNDRFEMDKDFQMRAEQFIRHHALKDKRYELMQVDVDAAHLLERTLQVVEERKLLELVTLPK